MDSVLDQLGRAGLESDDLEVRRRCASELRSARQANVLASESALAQPGELPEAVLGQIARDLQQAGYARLAHLVELRSPWGEPFFLGVVDHFLRRSLADDRETEALDDPLADSWRCLQILGRLVEEREEEIEGLLDRPAQPARGREEEVEHLYREGLSLSRHGEYQRAADHFTAALKLAPGDVRLYCQRGEVFRLLCQHERAIADFHVALRLNPSEPSVLLCRAIAYHLGGEHQRAVADCSAAVDLEPDNASAYRARGAARAALGDREQAIADLTQAAAGDRHTGSRGTWLEGDLDRAIADFAEALRLDPGNGQDHYRRGALYRVKGDLDRAMADLDEAIRRQPNNWAALYHRGKVLLSLGQYRLALLDLTEVVGLNPGLLAGYLSRALVYDQLGEHREGIADGTRAIDLDPSSPTAHFVRGLVHAHHGEHAAAIADLSDAIHRHGDFALAYHERSMACALQGDHDQALADCHRLIALEPGNAQAYANRSIVYHFKGEAARALADYSRALEIDPKCILTGWSPSLAESARGEITRRIADYIDGLRPQSSAKPAGERPARRKPAASETATRESRAEGTVPDLSVPQPETTAAGEKIEPVEQEQPASALPEEVPIPLADLPAKVAGEKRPSDPPAAPVRQKVESKEPEPATPRRSSPRTITCRNCGRETEVILAGGGRVRCEHCNSLFPVWASGKPSGKKVQEKVPFLEKWQKPLTIGGGIAVLAGVLLLMYGPGLRRNAGRARVHPAEGTASLDGKPIPNASLFLHPIGPRDPRVPRPRAVIRADGTFVLGTYRKDDGAPAGDYKVSVQWFSSSNSGGPPRNQLPPRYAGPDTSGLTVRIQAGENRLPPLQLTGR
jgi:tetratricopeptide (TPR) repeat protein